MKDAFGKDLKVGDVVVYLAGKGNDHCAKIGVVTKFSENYPVVKSYDQQVSYGDPGKLGRTEMPSAARCIVIPLSAAPEKVQTAFREEFPNYFGEYNQLGGKLDEPKQKTIFFAGYWNSSHTLAKIEIELINTGTLPGWVRSKTVKVYAGGKGMLAGMPILDEEMESRIFKNYEDAREVMINDLWGRVDKLIGKAADEAATMNDLYNTKE